MFKYNPEDATSCLPEGEATLAIVKAEDKVSRAGNDMVVITFDAFVGVMDQLRACGRSHVLIGAKPD